MCSWMDGRFSCLHTRWDERCVLMHYKVGRVEAKMEEVGVEIIGLLKDASTMDRWTTDGLCIKNEWMVGQGQAHLWCSLQLLHLVAAQRSLDEKLHFGIELHECHIASVAHQQANAFSQRNLVIQKKIDEHEQANDIERDVSEQRPPGEVQHLFGEQGTHPDDKQDVEDGRTHNGTDAHVTVGDEDSYDRSEELWGRATCCHEGGPCYIIRDGQFLCDDSERRNKELITDNG